MVLYKHDRTLLNLALVFFGISLGLKNIAELLQLILYISFQSAVVKEFLTCWSIHNFFRFKIFDFETKPERLIKVPAKQGSVLGINFTV